MSGPDPKDVPRLRLQDAEGEEKTILLVHDVFRIGRMGENDLKISDSHVSRMHAEIVKDGDNYRLIDRNSKSGTFVNGERILSHTLRHGDRMMFGQSVKSEVIFLTGHDAFPSPLYTPSTTTSFLTKDSTGDLRHVSRFLEGVRHFSAGVPLQEVLDVVLDMAIEISGADRAFLVLLGENSTPSFRSGRNKAKESLRADHFQISTNILQQVLATGKRVVMSQDSNPDAFAGFESVVALELRTVVCLPLHGMDHEVMGALYLDSKVATKGLSTISKGLLESLANDASAVLINMQLLKESREKELLELELETAREIQESLLPDIHGSYGSFEGCAENRPSRRISGDYYDLVSLPEERFAVVIADVSGKGIPAAILTSLVQGALFVEVSRSSNPVECVESLNRFLVRRSGTNRFVSLFLAMVDAQGRMSYVNAGHNPPMVVRSSGDIEELSARGLVLGVIEQAVFEQKTVTLEPGDLVCFYTDGVTEATNAKGEFFGEERLRETLQRGPRHSAEAILNCVLQHVTEYTGETPRSDDLTLLMLRRL